MAQKRGRKDLWTTLEMESKLEMVRGWCRDGATDEWIYTTLGVSKDTFYKWKREKPEFKEALKPKEIVDREVENALLKRALGFDYYTEEVVNVGKGKQEIKTLKKYEPPNTTAIIFWLKNRKPAEWRDKRDVGVEGDITFAIELPDDLKGDDE